MSLALSKITYPMLLLSRVNPELRQQQLELVLTE